MRIATEGDLADIVAIYNSTVASRLSTADTIEVSVESKRQWFQQHDPDSRPLFVHEQEGRVIAWVSFQSFYGRPAYDHTVELSIYIDQHFRGKGMGKTLLAEVLAMTGRYAIKTVVCYIFSHNIASIRLFESFGFAEWGRLPRIAEMDGREYSVSILGKRVNV